MTRTALAAPAALAAALCVSCGVDPVGLSPPDDAFYFPVGVAAHPEGRYLYVTNSVFDRKYNAGTITVYDTVTRRILPDATTRVGLFAGEIVLGRPTPESPLFAYTVTRDDGDEAPNTAAGLVQLAVQEEGRLACTLGGERRADEDPCVFTGFDDEEFADDPYGLALHGGGLFVTHIRRGIVSRWDVAEGLDTETPSFQADFGCRLNLPAGASSVAAHPVLGWGYVTDRLGQSIEIVEAELPDRVAEGTVADECELSQRASITVDPGGERGQTRGLAFSADGTLLYVAGSFDQSLKIFNTALETDEAPRNRLVATVVLGDGPDVVRVAGLRPGESYAAGGERTEAQRVVDQKGMGLVYATVFDEDRVLVVDPATLSVVARVDVGDGPHDIAFLPDADGALRGYVTNFNDHSLSVLDLEPSSPRRFTEIARVRR